MKKASIILSHPLTEDQKREAPRDLEQYSPGARLPSRAPPSHPRLDAGGWFL